MCGTDHTRVVEKFEEIEEFQKSKLISRVNFNGKDILMSDKLNVIVGGRGRGKSTLLESIAYKFNSSKPVFTNYESKRKNFLRLNKIEIYDFSGKLVSDSFEITFLNQSFINALFLDATKSRLSKYFSNELEEISQEITSSRVTTIKACLLDDTDTHNYSQINVSNLEKTMTKIMNKSLITNRKTSKINDIKYGFGNQNNHVSLGEFIFEELQGRLQITDRIQNLINELNFEVLKKMIDETVDGYEGVFVKNAVSSEIQSYNQRIDSEYKSKVQAIQEIENKLDDAYARIMKEIRKINKIYSVTTDKTELKINSMAYEGFDGNKFIFSDTSSVEHPVEYATRLVFEKIDGRKYANKEELSNKEIFLYLLFDKSFEKSIFVENVISSELIDDVYSYQNPKVSDEIAIYHVQYKKGKLLNLLNESPGVQTNSIMEFIFHKNSDIPILIDQPEDNVDNYARYNELTKWIAKAKFYRQIILVSHDANIVINGDTENLIAAEYENGVFEFTYGALEHGNNLEIAAEVLDGGKVAIRRRAKKYGL